MAHLQFKKTYLAILMLTYPVSHIALCFCLTILLNCISILQYHKEAKNAIEKWKFVRKWKVSSVCTLRYLIINNPMNPDALYQDQSDKTPQQVKSNLISNQSIGYVLKADYFDHPKW